MNKIDLACLKPMDIYAQDYPLRIDLAYARSDNFLFGEALYRPEARLWLHEDLAAIILKASKICFQEYGLYFVLYDGLRTVEAQTLMLETKKVKDNPHWLEKPQLLSPPGSGGHPRGMAIDLSLETSDGQPVNMGTVFDYLSDDPAPEHNPAHRDHPHFSPEIKDNRLKLANSMMKAAHECDMPLLPLPQEWWDFRFPFEIYERFEPLYDSDLPPDMRLALKL